MSAVTLDEAVLPRTNAQGYYEMRLESIGGLGAHLAGQTLAEAAVLGMGLDGSHFSSYGSEKKGSAVRSFVRLTRRGHGVRTSAPVDRPHLVAIFHEALARAQNVVEGLEPGGVVVVNTHRDPRTEAERLNAGGVTVGVVDALHIALEERTRINTAMLGAITRASGFFDREAVRAAVVRTFAKKRYAHVLEANLRTFDRGYDEVHLEFIEGEMPEPRPALGPEMGYSTAPIGGAILHPANSIIKDMSPSRQGVLPTFHRERCIDCGLCDMVCPDLCFVWEEGLDSKGRPAMVLRGIDYQFCKGCLKCVEACPTDPSALEEMTEEEGWAEAHRETHFPEVLHEHRIAAGAGSLQTLSAESGPSPNVVSRHERGPHKRGNGRGEGA